MEDIERTKNENGTFCGKARNKTKRITKAFKIKKDLKKKYRNELNRQAREYVLLPTILFALFFWLFFIRLDKVLCPGNLPIVLLRWGLSFVGILSLILYFFSRLRENKSYSLLLSIVWYTEFSAAVIVGLSGAEPVYMSGLLMIIILLPLFPLLRRHSISILVVTLFLFFVVGLASKMNFNFSQGEGLSNLLKGTYLWYNLIAAVLVSIAAIYVLDALRRRNYEANLYQERATRLVFDQLTKLEEAHIQLDNSNRTLYEANIQLDISNEQKSRLLSMAAHDLRNALQIILFHTKDLADLETKPADSKLSDRIKESANKINKNAERMTNLIEKTLAKQGIDSGNIKLSKGPVNVAEEAGKMVNDCKLLAQEKNQQIIFEAEKECIVYGDSVRLQQVMENLICNAVKYSPPGKSIWVTVGCDKTTVTFKVRDEGPGLTEEDKKNLFKEYQRLSPKPTAGETSTGLGLSIVRTLVKLHEGDIRVESEPGKGSTFIAEIPAYKNS